MNKKAFQTLLKKEVLFRNYNIQAAVIEFILSIIFNTIIKALEQEGSLNINRFGKFTVKDQKQRWARNPRTGEDILIPARKTVKFKLSPSLRRRFNEG